MGLGLGPGLGFGRAWLAGTGDTVGPVDIQGLDSTSHTQTHTSQPSRQHLTKVSLSQMNAGLYHTGNVPHFPGQAVLDHMF